MTPFPTDINHQHPAIFRMLVLKTDLSSDEMGDSVMEGRAVDTRHPLHQQLHPLLLSLLQTRAGDHQAHHCSGEHGVVELWDRNVLRETGEKTHGTWAED